MLRIRELRDSKGINMREAAKRLNLPYTTYVGYEKGQREPTSEVLIQLADFYETTVDYIVGRTGTIAAEVIPMDTIGSRIKRAREKADITQEQLGKMCHTTKQTIFKYESGVVTNIPMDRIIAIARALGTNPCEIMGWDEPECPKDSRAVIRTASALTPDESDLLRKYRALDDSAKDRIRHMLDYEYNAIPGSAADTAPKEA